MIPGPGGKPGRPLGRLSGLLLEDMTHPARGP